MTGNNQLPVNKGPKPIFYFKGSLSDETRERIAWYISETIQPEGRLVDPFCGSCGVPFRSGHRSLYLSDAQSYVTLVFETIRHKPVAFWEAYQRERTDFLVAADCIGNTAAFKATRDNPPNDPIQRAAWFIIMTQLSSYARRWSVDGRNCCNSNELETMANTDTSRLRYLTLTREQVTEVHRWLVSSNITIQSLDYKDAIEQTEERDTLFLNPPSPGFYDWSAPYQFTLSDLIYTFRRVRQLWLQKRQVVIHTPLNREIVFLLYDWCRLFVLPLERWEHFHQKEHVVCGLLAISRPIQMELFPCEITERLQEQGIKELLIGSSPQWMGNWDRIVPNVL